MPFLPTDLVHPRLRHVGLLVLFFAVLLGILAPAAKAVGAQGILNPTLLLMVAAPWLLGVLILVFERKSRVKFWAAPLLLSFLAPALIACLNWQVFQVWHQNVPVLIATLLINIICIGKFTLYVRSMCPTRCPECQNWSMIPVRNFWGAEARIRNTRWCASCSALYWRTREGVWMKERRRIWLELPTSEPASGKRDAPPFDTDSRVIAPVVGTRVKPRLRRSVKVKPLDNPNNVAVNEGSSSSPQV